MHTVLVVEDNVLNVKLAEAILEGAGYRVLIAVNAEEALPLVRTERPDVVLMDIQLPGMDGLTALQQIRSDPQSRATKVIAVTAMAMVGDRDMILRGGFDGYVSKPFKMKQLLDAVQAVTS